MALAPAMPPLPGELPASPLLEPLAPPVPADDAATTPGATPALPPLPDVAAAPPLPVAAEATGSASSPLAPPHAKSNVNDTTTALQVCSPLVRSPELKLANTRP